MPNNSSSLKHQSGVVMVIGLIMLLLLTLIGVTASQVTGLEEKMAGNANDYNLAFQSAEAALREGESYIEGLTTTTDFDGSNAGLLQEGDTTDQSSTYYTSPSTWVPSPSSSILTTGSYPQLPSASQPRYIIKIMSTQDTDSNASLNVGGYGETTAGGATTALKVTSRSTGRTGSSHVVLQSFYAKKF